MEEKRKYKNTKIKTYNNKKKEKGTELENKNHDKKEAKKYYQKDKEKDNQKIRSMKAKTYIGNKKGIYGKEVSENNEEILNDFETQAKNDKNKDNKTLQLNEHKEEKNKNLENNEIKEKHANIEKFYLLDNNIALRNINKCSFNDNNEKIELVYFNNNNETIKDLYRKKDFIEYYEFIYVQKEEKNMNFLFPKYRYKNLLYSENDIMKEIKISNCCKKVEKEFNIDLNSLTKKIFFKKIKSKENIYNLEIEDIKNINNSNNEQKNTFINTNKTNYTNNTDIDNNKNDIDKNIINNESNKISYNFNNNINNANAIQNYNIKNKIYYFPLAGLNNVGLTCFMNATLQCLIHIPELSLYFLNEYPKDKATLKFRNAYCRTGGNLSEAYYQVVIGVDKISKQGGNNYYYSYSPRYFKEILGRYNSQFSRYEANDSKDLILYLLQTFHEELNYFGNNVKPKNIKLSYPTLREYTYQSFHAIYDYTNFSKISQLFYGTYENVITCLKCKNNYYSYQKFEYISLSTYNYRNRTFDIMDGFKDMICKQKLCGNNQYFCHNCNKLEDADIFSKIIDLPTYIVLNIDYGKNKIYDVRELIFEHVIDLKPYIGFYFGQRSKYKLIAVCTHIGYSGATGHYIAYCLDTKNDRWYKFNDSSCRFCDKYELNGNSPYLLIYELI